MTVGEKIKNKRLELGWSQDELAKRCGYKSRSSINKIELARDLPLKKIEIMAKVLGVTPGYLMGWEEPQPQIHIDYMNEDIANTIVQLRSEGTSLKVIQEYFLLSPQRREIVMNLVHSLLLDEHPEQSHTDNQ